MASIVPLTAQTSTSAFVEKALDFLFPPVCGGCGVEGRWVCQECARSLVPHPNDSCPLCQKPSLRGFVCLRCREESALTQVIAALQYDDRIRRIVHRIKFGYVSSCILPLTHFMIDAYRRFGNDENPIVVPVPLHRRRLRERGFNQAAFFAQAFCSANEMQMRPDMLRRKKATKAQAELERADRQDNVVDAFLCPDPNAVKGSSILLVDDVFTTGATLQEAARTLRSAGAGEVAALTLAHG